MGAARRRNTCICAKSGRGRETVQRQGDERGVVEMAVSAGEAKSVEPGRGESSILISSDGPTLRCSSRQLCRNILWFVHATHVAFSRFTTCVEHHVPDWPSHNDASPGITTSAQNSSRNRNCGPKPSKRTSGKHEGRSDEQQRQQPAVATVAVEAPAMIWPRTGEQTRAADHITKAQEARAAESDVGS